MALPTNHWKLGLFVVSTVVLGIAIVVILGAQTLQKQTTSYKTYFDESVQGLEVGSGVKFRGVTVGNVSKIGIAPDHRLVEVTSELFDKEIRRLRLSSEVGKKKPKIDIASDLRMQLDSAGITGVKFLLLDFFPEADNPPPELPFPPPENYIPAAVSVMKNLQGSVVRALNRLPEVTDGLLVLLQRVDRVVTQFEERQLPVRAAATLVKVERLLASIQKTVADLHTNELSKKAQQTLGNISATTVKLNGLIDKLAGVDGVLASVQRATDSVADVAQNASGAGAELDETLRAVRDAASSVQKLADALETDSDMLLKGRTKRAP